MNAKKLKLKASEAAPAIDWAAVDAAPLADAPDEDSPLLTTAQAAQLRPLGEVLPTPQLKPALAAPSPPPPARPARARFG